MNYSEGIKYMQDLCDNEKKGVFFPESTYKKLKIYYPGYKNHGDYRLEIEGQNAPPKHTDICKWLYNMLINKQCEFIQLKKLLTDIYENGTNVCVKRYSIPEVQKIVSLIYWITLQDEINYPQPKYQGRRMPFSRYFEAMYCAEYKCSFDLDMVLDRCKNKGYIPCIYDLSNAPSFYY